MIALHLLRVLYSLVIVFSWLPLALASGSVQNVFTNPSGNSFVAQAGSSLKLTWTNPSPGTVTLSLCVNGGPIIDYIVSDYKNIGSYIWNIPSDFTPASGYGIQIQSDSDSSIFSLSTRFAIQAPVISSAAATLTSTISVAAAPASAAAPSVVSSPQPASSQVSTTSTVAPSSSLSVSSATSSSATTSSSNLISTSMATTLVTSPSSSLILSPSDTTAKNGDAVALVASPTTPDRSTAFVISTATSFSTATSAPPGAGGLDESAKIGIGVGVGVGLLLLILLVVGILYIRRLLRSVNGKGNGIREGDLSPEDAVGEPKIYYNGMEAASTVTGTKTDARTRVEPTLISEHPCLGRDEGYNAGNECDLASMAGGSVSMIMAGTTNVGLVPEMRTDGSVVADGMKSYL